LPKEKPRERVEDPMSYVRERYYAGVCFIVGGPGGEGARRRPSEGTRRRLTRVECEIFDTRDLEPGVASSPNGATHDRKEKKRGNRTFRCNGRKGHGKATSAIRILPRNQSVYTGGSSVRSIDRCRKRGGGGGSITKKRPLCFLKKKTEQRSRLALAKQCKAGLLRIQNMTFAGRKGKEKQRRGVVSHHISRGGKMTPL